jgi:hypothetical protein
MFMILYSFFFEKKSNYCKIENKYDENEIKYGKINYFITKNETQSKDKWIMSRAKDIMSAKYEITKNLKIESDYFKALNFANEQVLEH